MYEHKFWCYMQQVYGLGINSSILASSRVDFSIYLPYPSSLVKLESFVVEEYQAATVVQSSC
jgi:hypothetical protein